MPVHEFRLPGVIRVGVGSHLVLPDASLQFGKRILVVSDRNCAAIPEVAATIDALASRAEALVRFLDVPGEPTTTEVAAGLQSLDSLGFDDAGGARPVVVGIGGGSVLDTAKAIAAMATNTGSIADYVGRDKVVRPRLPLVLAPTTAGTGSEATRYTVITDPITNVKMLITDWSLLPDIAVVDPLFVVGSPRSVTASAGVDALTHAIEAYVSQRHQPTADLFALGAIRDLYPHLAMAWDDGTNIGARMSTLIGALHAGIAFSNSSVALVHGMSRPIGAHFHVAHGLSNSMLLPEITAWSLAKTPGRYQAIADAMGLSSPTAIPDALATLAERLRIPRLGAVIDAGHLRTLAPQMARDALASGSPQNNPRVPTETDIIDLYHRCL